MSKKKIILAAASALGALVITSCAGSQGPEAPPFTLKDNTGRQVSLSDYAGNKAVLLIFFNFNTGTGRDPILQSYLAYYQGMDKLETVCVMNRATLPEEVKQFMASQSTSGPGRTWLCSPPQG